MVLQGLLVFCNCYADFCPLWVYYSVSVPVYVQWVCVKLYLANGGNSVLYRGYLNALRYYSALGISIFKLGG